MYLGASLWPVEERELTMPSPFLYCDFFPVAFEIVGIKVECEVSGKS